MKRWAIGALVLSLVAGSAAMAGNGYRRELDNRDPPSHGRDGNQGRHERHGDDRGGNGNRGGDSRHWDRDGDHGRGNWNARPDNRHWNPGRDRFDRNWNRGPNGFDNGWRRGHDGSWRGDVYRDRYRPVPRYAPAPRYGYAPYRNYGWDRPRYNFGYYQRPPGYYSHYWRRGERLPYAYYTPGYVISDYGSCGLRRPPFGYHWVRVDRDVVLAAITTGIILDIAYNHLY